MTKAEARKRVRRGAKLLDAKRPGWFRRVKVGQLDMMSAQACIVGQSFFTEFHKSPDIEEYATPWKFGVTKLGVSGNNGGELYGFQPFSMDDPVAPEQTASLLAEAWIEEIRTRRARKPTSKRT